ncbi:hypothetical protein HK101_008548 [Irineochytrium annulatum]|nr:hypothetical protein HK101_008548 [Irineochytrium annulatum]
MLDSINAAGASTETAEANPEHEIKHEEGDAMEEDAGARQHKYLEEDLIAEHFGFVPMEFMDEVFCAMSQIATEAMNEFEEFVKGELEDEEAVDKGMAKLETLIDNAIDWCFDKCEVYVTRNIFKFPSDVGVTLPHYRALNLTLTEKDELDLDRTIAETRQKLVAVR